MSHRHFGDAGAVTRMKRPESVALTFHQPSSPPRLPTTTDLPEMAATVAAAIVDAKPAPARSRAPVYPQGATVSPQEAADYPRGAGVSPQGVTVNPCGYVVNPREVTATPCGAAVNPRGVTVTPCGVTVTSAAGTAGFAPFFAKIHGFPPKTPYPAARNRLFVPFIGLAPAATQPETILPRSWRQLSETQTTKQTRRKISEKHEK